jgi:hypothetical protein
MYCSITGWRSMDVGPALEKLKPTCHRTLVRVRVRIRVACVVCDRGRACINGRRCGGPTGRGWQPRRGLLERCMCELTPSPVKRHCFLTQPIIARPFWGRHDPAHYRTLAWSGQHQRRPGQPMRLRRPSVRPSHGPLCARYHGGMEHVENIWAWSCWPINFILRLYCWMWPAVCCTCCSSFIFYRVVH